MKKTLVMIMTASIFLLALAAPVQAKNPILSYFSRFLDETKAELAIGEIIWREFSGSLPPANKIEYDEVLTTRAVNLADSAPRNQLQFQVYVVKSDVPDEICFPGGKIILTTALLEKTVSDEQKNFLLARNIILISHRMTMKLIKNQGLYARFMNQIKIPEGKRDSHQVKLLIKDYIRNGFKMDHQKADLQGILLTRSPEKTRIAAIELLKSFSDSLWPEMPWDRGDLSSRIKSLEELKLPK